MGIGAGGRTERRSDRFDREGRFGRFQIGHDRRRGHDRHRPGRRERQRGVGAGVNDGSLAEHEVLSVAKDLVECVVGDEDVTDRVLDPDRRCVSGRDVHGEAFGRRAQRQAFAVRECQRKEEDVDEAIGIGHAGLGGVEHVQYRRRSGRHDDAPAEHDRLREVQVHDLARVRADRRQRIVEYERQRRVDRQRGGAACRSRRGGRGRSRMRRQPARHGNRAYAAQRRGCERDGEERAGGEPAKAISRPV